MGISWMIKYATGNEYYANFVTYINLVLKMMHWHHYVNDVTLTEVTNKIQAIISKIVSIHINAHMK